MRVDPTLKNHEEDTPITHVAVDALAKTAAKLPLPEQWRQLLSPGYTILSGGLTHNETELRTLLIQRLREREIADLPAHLRHLAQPSLDHSLSLKLWNNLMHPSISETLLRLRFGITRVHSSHDPGTGHTCDHCKQVICGPDGTPITRSRLHGTEYISHVLFSCQANSEQQHQLQKQCDTFTAALRMRLGNEVPAFRISDVVADLLRPQADTGPIRIDPRGFCNNAIRQQIRDAGASVRDLADLYEACQPALYATLRLAAFGQQRPQSPQHSCPHHRRRNAPIGGLRRETLPLP